MALCTPACLVFVAQLRSQNPPMNYGKAMELLVFQNGFTDPNGKMISNAALSAELIKSYPHFRVIYKKPKVGRLKGAKSKKQKVKKTIDTSKLPISLQHLVSKTNITSTVANKIVMLKSIGFNPSEILDILAKNPHILISSSEKI